MGLISLKRCFVRQLLDKLCELWKSCNWAAQTFHILAFLPRCSSVKVKVFSAAPRSTTNWALTNKESLRRLENFDIKWKAATTVKQDWRTLKPIGKAEQSWKFVFLFASFQTHTYDVKQMHFKIKKKHCHRQNVTSHHSFSLIWQF